MDNGKLHRTRLLVALAALPVMLGAAVMLGACGGSGDSSSDTSSAQGADASSAAQAGQAQFAQCMRKNGVTNFPDPQNGHFIIPGNTKSNPHFNAAVKKCQHLLGPGGLGSNSQNKGNQQAQLAFAHCMQTHGVPNFPEPNANGAVEGQKGQGVDQNSPTYKKAFNTCKSKLPGNGKGVQLGNGSQG